MIFQQEKCVFFLHVCFHRMLNVENNCLIPKHKRNWKGKNRVTTFACDSLEDSMVQNDKDVDASMHLKITVVELQNACCLGLTKIYKLATFCKVGLMMCSDIWRQWHKENVDNVEYEKNKINSNFDEAISKNITFITFCFFKPRHYFKLLSKRFSVFKFAGCFLMEEFLF